MNATPGNYADFEKWLENRCSHGETAGARAEAWSIFKAFLEASKGSFRKFCPCGKPATQTATIQPAPTWAAQIFPLCETHFAIVRAFDIFREMILKKERETNKT